MRSRQYGRDVLAPENRKPRPGQGPVPQVEAERGPGRGGLRGAVLRRGRRGRAGAGDAGGPLRQAPGVPAARHVPARRQAGHAGPARAETGARRRRRAPHRVRVGRRARSSGPRSPRPAGSTSRASTTPSWWRRSGATTCATSASSSSTWRASTTCRPSSRDFEPGRGRRLGVLVDHLVAGSKESRIAAAVGRRPERARRRPPVHRHLGGGQAGRRRPRRPGRTCRGGCRGRKACCARIGWPHETPQDVAAAWRRILRAVDQLRRPGA